MKKIILCLAVLFSFAAPCFAGQEGSSATFETPQREGSMGDISPTRSRDIYKIILSNTKDEQIGQIWISGFFDLRESWDHLKGGSDPTPAGPHNRRVIETLISGHASPGYMTTTTKEEKKTILQIAEDLNKNNGILQDGKEPIALTDPAFKEAFVEYMKTKHDLTAIFSSDLE